MTDLENTVVTSEAVSPEVKPEVIQAPTETGVRNPDKLLELYNSQKEELKELKAFKESQTKAQSKAEQKRLEDLAQYEALVPLKVKEATEPLSAQLAKIEAEKIDIAKKLAESKAQYEKLQSDISTANTKATVYSEFLAQKGDPSVSSDEFWNLYGSKVTLDKSGVVSDIPNLFKTVQESTLGKRLFLANVPSGTGTPASNGSVGKVSNSTEPRVVTQAQLLNPKKYGITTEDVRSGKIIVRG
jgi:hypothetical protein